MSQPFGAFVLILHGHIPYVLKGERRWPHGSDMLCEAAAETYIPLLWCVEELAHEGISANFTLSLSPITVEQLSDERFPGVFKQYLQERIETAAEDRGIFQVQGHGHLAWLADKWRLWYTAVRDAYVDGYGCDLMAAFRRMQEAGNIELMTCGATHGYFPLLHEDGSIAAQVKLAAQCHEQHFGRRPRGLWLPECAYRPRAMWGPPPEIGYLQDGIPEPPFMRQGVEEIVGFNGFDYFIVDTHMLGGGHPLPVDVSREETLGKAWSHLRHVREASPYFGPNTPYRPYFVGGNFEDHPPVAIFARDPETSRQVWSGFQGYPGDHWYLEFHKKRTIQGLRYWRVTDDSGDLGAKGWYEPERADEQMKLHAGHFLQLVKDKLRAARHEADMPVVCAPFDAELFGHWWFEGTSWLTKTLRWMNLDPDIAVMKASEYLGKHSPDRAVVLPEGSWGAGGTHHVWMNSEVAWTWHRVYDAEKDYVGLVKAHGRNPRKEVQDLLQQAARELLLMQASDWQFLITTWSAHDYASERLQRHYDDYKFVGYLARQVAEGRTVPADETRRLARIVDEDRPFDGIDPLWWIGE